MTIDIYDIAYYIVWLGVGFIALNFIVNSRLLQAIIFHYKNRKIRGGFLK